jgi:hypothetical protein
MRYLSARDLVVVWESGEDLHPVDRALVLLTAACPEQTWDELAAFSVGQRDTRLLALRERTFGPSMQGFSECPRCSERLEFEMAVADIRTAGEAAGEEARELVADGLKLWFRLPDSRDLGAVVGSRDPVSARNLLARRCVLRASRGGQPVDDFELSPGVISRLARRMAECDPQAEVLLDLRCPTCEHGWQESFDIVTFFWAELTAWVRRLLREVHTLALAYGWREADVLNMSARRRRFYLEMAG